MDVTRCLGSTCGFKSRQYSVGLSVLMSMKHPDYNQEDAVRRRESALARSQATPHLPHRIFFRSKIFRRRLPIARATEALNKSKGFRLWDEATENLSYNISVPPPLPERIERIDVDSELRSVIAVCNSFIKIDKFASEGCV